MASCDGGEWAGSSDNGALLSEANCSFSREDKSLGGDGAVA